MTQILVTVPALDFNHQINDGNNENFDTLRRINVQILSVVSVQMTKKIH